MFHRRRRDMGSRRRGVIYNMDEEGKARLVFESASSFEGTLEAKSGEILSIRGIKGARDDSVNIQVIVGETGSQFFLEDATIKYDGQSATIEHPAMDYASDERLIGMRARKEIQEYLNPRLAEEHDSQIVFKGYMKVKLLTSYQTKPVLRRESVCEDSTTIIEQSEDFFA
ncbi:hypothetical protein PFISCL1PPCAC_170 [Pristionchus fissidentatus]|uniref:Uncharacterized protein n=1 Tax=Pristionchus fissidentatus TaxID=1538716 RepID=A0AAV5URS3_9BILA|nr:hypothetical protein PFISCL1PPCAC_170 [Pristionchus fissidentatus]